MHNKVQHQPAALKRREYRRFNLQPAGQDQVLLALDNRRT